MTGLSGFFRTEGPRDARVELWKCLTPAVTAESSTNRGPRDARVELWKWANPSKVERGDVC